MGSDFMGFPLGSLISGFNPRSHMGSDSSSAKGRAKHDVSIHAPTWGATKHGSVVDFVMEFQSTLPHGERPLYCITWWQGTCFNPRSHMGSDLLEVDLVEELYQWQSTLPHGERLRIDMRKKFIICFNPRSHMGSDSRTSRTHVYVYGFNPRSHMGSDLHLLVQGSNPESFNPRSHMGSDQASPLCPQGCHVSIHAPTWGATGELRC